MVCLSNIHMDIHHSTQDLEKRIRKELGLSAQRMPAWSIARRSLDARKKMR